jgi:hypothetical protein
LTAGIYAAKALLLLLRGRFHDTENVQVLIPGVPKLSRRKFSVQEVLMHMCLPSLPINALFGLSKMSVYFSIYRKRDAGKPRIPFSKGNLFYVLPDTTALLK